MSDRKALLFRHATMCKLTKKPLFGPEHLAVRHRKSNKNSTLEGNHQQNEAAENTNGDVGSVSLRF